MGSLLLRPMEAAELLGIGRTSIYEMLSRNELPGIVNIGRSVRVSRQALEKWVESQASDITQ